MARILSILLAISLLLLPAAFAENAPAPMAFTQGAALLGKAGDTLDAAALLENAPEAVNYVSAEETVATVDANGLVTAVSEGVATIVAISAADNSVYASLDVAVYDYSGLWTGSKHVDAMNCDIDIELTLNEDGTFAFVRAPMTVAISGGGEMPALEDAGTYVIEGGEFRFTADSLGEFSAAFGFDAGAPVLSGKLPTGGPTTDMILARPEAVEE